jgi:outer membrane protein assembly factor BamB
MHNHLPRAASTRLTVAGIAVLATTLVGFASNSATAAPTDTSWTVYHGDAAGTGVSTAFRAVDTAERAWASPALDGEIYGEPLVYANDVYVATESDTVYALNATRGSVVWSRHFANAVPSSDLPCGNIAPTVGITGTPVIDPSRNEIFVVADELVNGGPQHFLEGLSTKNGAIELRERVDPPGSVPSALLQRTGLNLVDGRVVFGMGGNDGDCATYRGRVISVKETGSRPDIFTVDSHAGDSQGAIWMGGAAPVIDAKGNVWVSAGNGSVNNPSQGYDDSDSVLELTATGRLEQYFAPSTWPANNAADLDMSAAPALLADGEVLIAGKSAIAYLLNGAHLGGIGHEQTSLASVCGNNIDGGVAFVGMTVYLPCLNGTVAIRVTKSPPAMRVLWSANISGSGPPLVVAGLVWTVGKNGVLYGLDAASGQVRRQVNIGAVANDFTTPSVGDGFMLVASTNRVLAFRGTP